MSNDSEIPKKRIQRTIVPKNMQEIRERIYQHMPGGLSGFFKQYFVALQEIDDPVERTKALERIMPYFMPKMKAVEIKQDGPQNPIQLNFISSDGTKQTIESSPSAMLDSDTSHTQVGDIAKEVLDEDDEDDQED